MIEKTSSRAKVYFTLIELLVVVAIIAVLASMLLPALTRARDHARRIYCVGNLKQIAIITENYATDYKAYPYLHYTQGVWAPYAQTLLQAYEFPGVAREDTIFMDCPKISPEHDPISFSHYAVNRGQTGSHSVFHPTAVAGSAENPLRPRHIQNASTVMMFTESTATTKFGWPAWYARCLIHNPNDNVVFHFRHVGRTNMVFFNGHVQSVSPAFCAANEGDFWTHKSKLH